MIGYLQYCYLQFYYLQYCLQDSVEVKLMSRVGNMRWENNASRHVGAKRGLGEGRWDRILKRKLVELSEADNYEDAKYEWKATGKCWWSRNNQDVPNWVSQTNHVGECLCGHNIVYHFGIQNTINGHVDVVGSDHITSYLILREITDSQNISESEVTEAMIQEWIDVRVKAMKAESWWAEKGEKFERDFNLVKDADLRINILKTNKSYFDETLKMNRPVTKIRKRSQGEQLDDDYKMASIVWRWNHPDNPKNQQTKRGYPDEKLLIDIIIFKKKLTEHMEKIAKEDNMIEARLELLAQSEVKFKDAIKSSIDNADENQAFARLCEAQGFPYFDETFATNTWEASFIKDMQNALTQGRLLSDRQSQTLLKIVRRRDEPATEKQINYLRRLGYAGDYALLTKQTASTEIDYLIQQGEQNGGKEEN